MATLPMWDGQKKFSYEGSVKEGIKIGGTSISVSASQFSQLLKHFAGRGVPLGISEEPPENSVGYWLRKKILDDDNIAQFIGAILVKEGYVDKLGHTHVVFR